MVVYMGLMTEKTNTEKKGYKAIHTSTRKMASSDNHWWVIYISNRFVPWGFSPQRVS